MERPIDLGFAEPADKSGRRGSGCSTIAFAVIIVAIVIAHVISGLTRRSVIAILACMHSRSMQMFLNAKCPEHT